jgi:hypothetical protein
MHKNAIMQKIKLQNSAAVNYTKPHKEYSPHNQQNQFVNEVVKA